MRRLGLIVLALLALPIGLAGLSSRLTPFCSDIPPLARFDLAFVLGAGTRDSGLPDSESRTRIEAAAALWQGGQVQRLHVSGNGSRHPVSASEAMRRHALSLGVPAQVITVETRSDSTLENVAFSRAALAQADSVIMVTSGFHSWRAGLTMRIMGYAPTARCRSVPDPAKPFVDRLRSSLLAGPKWWVNMARTALWRGAQETGTLPYLPRILWQ